MFIHCDLIETHLCALHFDRSNPRRLYICIVEYAGHACEMMKSIDLDEWYGIVIVSGDGLMHEVSVKKNWQLSSLIEILLKA